MTDQFNPTEIFQGYVDSAREVLADLANNPAPCGHYGCTEKDQKTEKKASELADLFAAHLAAMEVNPTEAATAFSVLDVSLIYPTIDRAADNQDPTIPARELHYLLMAVVVALVDGAAAEEPATA